MSEEINPSRQRGISTDVLAERLTNQNEITRAGFDALVPLPLAHFSAPNVHTVSNKLQVFRPDAVMDTTKVIPVKTSRWSTYKKLMGKPPLEPGEVKPAVTAPSISCTKPQGAAVRATGINLRPEALLRRNGIGILGYEGVAVLQPALVVIHAPAARNLRSRAIGNATLSLHREFTPCGVTRPDVDASRPLFVSPFYSHWEAAL